MMSKQCLTPFLNMKYYHNLPPHPKKYSYFLFAEEPYWTYFEKEWDKLDPQPGECFALFNRMDHLTSIILVVKKDSEAKSTECKMIKIVPKGLQRSDCTFRYRSLENYTDVLQIDSHRFHVLDKQIAMLNVLFNSVQYEIIKQLSEASE